MIWLAAASAAVSIYGGIQGYNAAKDTASLLKEQGAMAQEDYNRQAKALRDDAYRLQQTQTMGYISMGVEIQGTPLLLMKETEIQANYDATYLEKVGSRVKSMYDKKAKITKSEGVAKLISGITGGASAFAPKGG